MAKNRPTACFAGTRLEALQALQRYADVTSILTVVGSWVHKYCESNDLPVRLVDKYSRDKGFDFLSKQLTNIVLSAGFPFILPSYVLHSGPLFLNSHPSLLPAYKGVNAIKEAIKNGEEYMGVTVHLMVEQVDAGRSISQERVWVKGLVLQEIYDLLFGVVEPMTITRAMEILFHQGFLRTH